MSEPRLEAVCEIVVELGESLDFGETRRGLRRITPILGGSIAGLSGAPLGDAVRALRAEILSGGGDRQLVRAPESSVDGALTVDSSAGFPVAAGAGAGSVVEIDARYDAKTEQGALISIHAVGVRRTPGAEDPDGVVYFRVAIDFETADPALAALQDSLFVADGVRQQDRVRHIVYRVA